MSDVFREYYEAHITIEPIFDDESERFAIISGLCKQYQFRIAKLMMQKRNVSTEDRSKYDTFCTGRSYSEDDLTECTKALAEDLAAAGIRVWRYKIERTLLDTMYESSLLPSVEGLPEKYANPRDPCSNVVL